MFLGSTDEGEGTEVVDTETGESKPKEIPCCYVCQATTMADGSDPLNGSDLKQCSRCRTTHFCSDECFKEGWPGHKTECRAIRKLAAKKDWAQEELKPGQLLDCAFAGGGMKGVLSNIFAFI